MFELHIDIETYCEVDLKDTGVYPYAQHPSFSIDLFSYAWGDGEPVLVDLANGEEIPDIVWHALTDRYVTKFAHNANFEMVCIAEFYGLEIDPRQWFCTMVAAAYLGLPLGLDKLGEVLHLKEKKDPKGKALITYFSKPCKPTKANGGRTRNLPSDAPEKWGQYGGYNLQDVRVEMEVHKYVNRFPGLPAIEWEYWYQDQEINARGVYIDLEFINAAIELNRGELEEIRHEMAELTGVENPNSLAQLKAWLKAEGVTVASLNKEYLAEVDLTGLPPKAARLLELRNAGSKTSSSKFDKLLQYVCADGRVRGLIQFYGANATGRYAGRGVQIQNLKKTIKGDLQTAKDAVIKGLAELLYDNVTDLISRLIRPALIAAPGHTLVVSDFAAIEGRVLAWLAGEEWVLDVFRTHGKLYEATAANMFNVPISMVTKGSDLRAKGKVAALALGYQGASGALIKMGALREGLTEAELPPLVTAWRKANPRIVKFWRELENAARHVIRERSRYVLRKPYATIIFSYEKGYLFITLPSGRRLAYFNAHLEGSRICCYRMDQIKKIWVKKNIYGGLIAENITQAVARDCLVEAMYKLKDGPPIVLHVHDEIGSEVLDELADEALEEISNVMAQSPEWAPDLPLEGDGYISKYYRKD